MANRVKTQAKMQKARDRAKAERETAQAKAERKIAKARAELAVTEAKITARLEKVLEKGDRKLARGATARARAADGTSSPGTGGRRSRSAKR